MISGTTYSEILLSTASLSSLVHTVVFSAGLANMKGELLVPLRKMRLKGSA
jgi:hypothetical protein